MNCSGAQMGKFGERPCGWESAIAALEKGVQVHDHSRMLAAFGRRIKMISELLSGPWSFADQMYLQMVN